MFDHLQKVILGEFERAAAENKSVDYEQFGDPVASEVSWVPLFSVGWRYRARTLRRDLRGNQRFAASIAELLWVGALGVVGLTGCAYFTVEPLAGVFGGREFFGYALSLTPALVGLWRFYWLSIPIVFNVEKGYFCRGRLGFHGQPEHREADEWCPVDDIYALQLVSEIYAWSEDGYVRHELNIVRADASRVYVIEHSNRNKMRADARAVADALGVPLWDGSRDLTPSSRLEGLAFIARLLGLK